MLSQNPGEKLAGSVRRFRIFLLLLALVGLWAVAIWNSIRQPYIPSWGIYATFLFYLPLTITLMVVWIFSFYKRNGRNGWSTIYYKAGGGWAGVASNLKGLACVGALAFLVGFADQKILAWPTYYVARTSFSSVERVNKVGVFRFKIEGRSNIHLLAEGGGGSSFVWPSQDPVLTELKDGQCIRLIGRESVIGRWVERIERSPCPSS